jgi:hypothetical protein
VATLQKHREDRVRFIFCKDSFFGSDNERAPPRMLGGRTVRTCCDLRRSRSWLAYWRRARFNRRTWSQQPAPQHQLQKASHNLVTSRLGALGSLLQVEVLSLPCGDLPRLVPASITDCIA